ncbi:MAG TPA: AbrB/MazE/SpoVT family DNA-binding domain-containing protein [Aridibacter sp.]|nr:AbrB/MazE/SpoVT family DNA-binding domain-containing protein [Aridibacter sp.]
MVKVKIRKIGNSLGAILPADTLSRLQIEEGDEVLVSVDEEGIRLTPYDPDFEDTLQAARAGMKKYRNALRKLAK